MNPTIKAKWLAALRSGLYPQGTGHLKNAHGEFCCLGVLCEIHREEGLGGVWYANAEGCGYLGSSAVLPNQVMDWAGMTTDDPLLTPTDDVVICGADVTGQELRASTLNDGGATFTQIADMIERSL